MAWKKNTDTLHVLTDKYAHRFVEQLTHRCVAYKFFIGTATYSAKETYWYSDFVTSEDAVKAAKIRLMRGELEHSPDDKEEAYLTDINTNKLTFPLPEIEQRGW